MFKLVTQCSQGYSPSELNFRTGMAFVSMGVVQSVTGLLLRKFADRFNIYSIILLGTVLF
jgi:hypothetical protein